VTWLDLTINNDLNNQFWFHIDFKPFFKQFPACVQQEKQIPQALIKTVVIQTAFRGLFLAPVTLNHSHSAQV